MQFLHDLPEDHPDRNRPLVGCSYRHRDMKTWKEVKPTFKIATKSFNDLGTTWTANDLFTFDEVRENR